MRWKHHKLPRHAGGTDAASNIEVLDTASHAEAHRRLFLKHGRLQDKIAWLGIAGLIGREEIFKRASLLGARWKGRKGVAAAPAAVAKAIALAGGTANGASPNNFFHQMAECPRCGKIGQLLNLKRWHFENCKAMDFCNDLLLGALSHAS
jgi:hypothetical protein